MREAPRVRDARPADLDAIAGIELAAFEPARRSSRAVLRRALGSSFQRVLVAELDGVVVGFLVLWPHRLTWRVYNLASDPAWRNRGVAGALLDAAVALAVSRGALRMVLECRAEPGLTGFYGQRGYAVERRLPNYYGRGEHAVRMVRPLT